MTLTLLSFLAGFLTVLAPCTLPFLPVIIGGSAGNSNKFRPYIITFSLVISLLAFTLLLKISTLFINIDPVIWTGLSGTILIALGVTSLFPQLWDKISSRLNLTNSSNGFMQKFSKRDDMLGAVMTGLALGPVFSSCSPTYAFALATALQGDLQSGIINIISYVLGLATVMLLIGILGQNIIKRLKWVANPDGIFKKVIAIIFIILGLFIILGVDKEIQKFADGNTLFSVTKLDKRLLDTALNTTPDTNLDKSNNNLISKDKAVAAPELVGLQDWINSNPTTLKDLKGKVVLVDFWTYSCINCQRTQPYLNSWYDSYKDKGLTILGLHAPEFAFEKKLENVQKAVSKASIKYPVALDNDYATWNKFGVKGWPYKVLIDSNGLVRYTHFGEGDYDITEKNIQTLLQESNQNLKFNASSATQSQATNNKSTTSIVTPGDSKISKETYLGWSRNEYFAQVDQIKYNQLGTYTPAKDKELLPNMFSLNGNWVVNNENIESKPGDNNILSIKVTGKKVFLVAGSDSKGTIEISVNGKSKTIEVSDEQLYTIYDSSNADLNSPEQINSQLKDQVINLKVGPNVRLNAFTFG